MKKFEVAFGIGEEFDKNKIKRAALKEWNSDSDAKVLVLFPHETDCGEDFDILCMIRLKSLDARKEISWKYQIVSYRRGEERDEFRPRQYKNVSGGVPVHIVGGGPAGMFAALRLLTEGFRPIIIERGKPVDERSRDIALLNSEGILNPDSNYCFGEGGAGTFSDGKLYTRSSKRGDNREVLMQLVKFGADKSILYDSHPHIGTNKLYRIVSNIRECILLHGGEYHFNTRVTGISRQSSGKIEIETTNTENGNTRSFHAEAVILATGHSAEDIYEMCKKTGIFMEAKGFALGVRVEHKQDIINKARFGNKSGNLPNAEYGFVEQTDLGEVGKRGVFSFCMCPGGILVPSSTSDGTVVTNGMSNSARNSKWANSGVVVQINPGDIPDSYEKYGEFALLRFRNDIEKSMSDWVHSNANPENPFAAPAQRMEDFCAGRISRNLPETTYPAGVVSAPLHLILPDFVVKRLQQVFPSVGKRKMKGYFTNDALLIAVESRTSSPVRITRNSETYESVSMNGLFPAGEGAGYSGGIISSAVDGINCAVAAVKYLKSR